jgi:hypothetical protein
MTTIRAAAALLALSTLAAVDICAARQAAAEIYRPWCAQYTGRGAARNCGFTSYEQCMATARGAGAYCVQNPWYLEYGQGGRGSAGRYQNQWR